MNFNGVFGEICTWILTEPCLDYGDSALSSDGAALYSGEAPRKVGRRCALSVSHSQGSSYVSLAATKTRSQIRTSFREG